MGEQVIIDEREIGLRKLQHREQAAKGIIALFVGMTIITALAIFAAGYGYVWDRYFESLSISLYEIIDYANMGVLFGSWIIVGMWIHQAHRNIHEAELSGLEFTPGSAIWWFAVPVATFWKPFQAMRELWNASVYGYNETDTAAPGLLRAWWICWLVGSFATFALLSDLLYLISVCADVVSAVALWLIIDRISKEQASLGVGDVFA